MLDIREEKIKEVEDFEKHFGETATKNDVISRNVLGYDYLDNKGCTEDENLLRYARFTGLSFKTIRAIVDNPIKFVVKSELGEYFMWYRYSKDKNEEMPSEYDLMVMHGMLLDHIKPDDYYNVHKMTNPRLLKKIVKQYYKVLKVGER